MDMEICATAIDSNEPDYEDGIIRATEEAWRAEIIFTRDLEAFHNSRLTSMSPHDFLEHGR